MTWCWCVEASGDDGKAQGGRYWFHFSLSIRQIYLSTASFRLFSVKAAISGANRCAKFVFYLWWAVDKPDRTFVGLSLMTFSYEWVNYFSLLHEAEDTEAHAVLTSESAGLMMLWHVSTQDKQMCSQQRTRFLDKRISSGPRSINVSLTVSSVQMEWTCVPNITEVKMRKRRPSKHRRMRRMTVAGGEKELHSGERRDREEDVEGKRRWRHEEALQC